jgi:hypothetical protein
LGEGKAEVRVGGRPPEKSKNRHQPLQCLNNNNEMRKRWLMIKKRLCMWLVGSRSFKHSQIGTVLLGYWTGWYTMLLWTEYNFPLHNCTTFEEQKRCWTWANCGVSLMKQSCLTVTLSLIRLLDHGKPAATQSAMYATHALYAIRAEKYLLHVVNIAYIVHCVAAA